jgi:phospholipid/cholesterol/gamma-HCH transport system substrate-binding protein
MNWKAIRVLSLITAVCAGLVALLFIGRPFSHKLILKAYFIDGRDLRPGARVRLAGVDIGSVESVRVRPELREAPVEVTMSLMPSYELRVPNDSVATLRTAGVLGGTYVGIDISSAVGPPLQANGVLKTAPTTEATAEEMLKKIDEMLKKKECDLEQLKAESLQIAASPRPFHITNHGHGHQSRL